MVLKDVDSGVIPFFPLSVFWQDQSESSSCSLGQVISALCLLPQSLETVLPGVPGVMEPVYVACLCHQSLKHCHWLPQHWLPSRSVRKQSFTSWFGGGLNVWKSAASHGWLAGKKGAAAFWCSTHAAFVSSSWTSLCLSFMHREKGLAGLSVLTKFPLSKRMALKKSSMIEASSLHHVKLEKKKEKKPHIFSVSITADSVKYQIILSNTWLWAIFLLSCNINSKKKHPGVQQKNKITSTYTLEEIQ